MVMSMRNYNILNRFCTRGVQLLLLLALLMPTRMFGAGFTPTDGGLVVNLQKDDRFLLSVWVDKDKDGVEDEGEEYFVENYSRYKGDSYFTYDSASYILKLVPQGNVTKPSEMSIWTVDTALTRVQGGNNYSLGGISYTMWNDGRTIQTTKSTNDLYKFYGDLTSEEGEEAWKNSKLCDVVFVIPTDYDGIVSFDPGNTMGRGTTFNGRTGTGFLGMTYREVYWLEIPRFNGPVSYTNAAVVTINTTKTTITGKRCGNINSGRTAYAYAHDTKSPDHNSTPRTIFRLYLLDDPIVACPNTYFFAYDEQYRGIKYRKGPGTNPTLLWTDSTVAQTVYTMDRLFRMDRIGETKEYQTGLMKVPVSDSSMYYVGYDDDYRNGSSPTPPLASEPLGSSTAKSEFARIRQLPMYSLAGKYAPAGACGRMIIDTTSNVDNLNVKFQPAGYFLKVSTGKNVRLRQTSENVWICDEMWTITEDWSKLKIKATLMTGAEFSESDPGADVAGWSEFVTGTSVPVAGHPELEVTDHSGWARITTNDTDPNGHIEFVLANPSRHIHYESNGLHGVRLSDQYPVYGSTSVTIQTPEVSSDYTFSYWTTNADGTGTKYNSGAVVDLPEGTTTLYAQGTYKGSYNVALSFIHTDGKRYYMTHPGAKPPRYSRARHYDDWTNVWQGMADVNNNDPNFLSSFELRHPSNEVKGYQAGMPEEERHLENNEFVLDPRHYTVKGAIDSLTYYEFFKPGKDEYLGLYYTSPNTILANDTWAGLFKTTSTATTTGWPDFKKPYISGAKLQSTRYVEEDDPVGHPDELTLKIRGNNGEGEYVKYNASENQFDACVDPSTATVFDIATINVADEYFVVLPDTTEAWHDRIDFGYHTEALPSELVWLKLIGKQLMAFMRVGADTVYFHPNNDKIYSTSRDLASSSDFRLTQSIAFIRDARVTSVDVQDRPSMELADEYSRYITSGSKSPMEVKYRGRYVDIYDTLRITLTQGGISKIKKYYGRWNDRAANLHLKGSSRYRDIIIHTNTYHHGDTIFHPVLTPVDEKYTFNPLAGNSQTVNFKVTNYRTCKILDINNTVVDEIELEPEDITTSLALGPGACSFSTGGIFAIPEGGAVSQQVTLETREENKTADNIDSLKISTTVTINGVPYPVTASVPLIQTSLEGDELIWSVNYDGKQYYIMAGTGGLIFRKYNQKGTTLYKEGTTDVRLVKGSADAENSDAKYITPWHFSYNEADINQVKLQTQDGVNRYLKMLGDEVGAAAGLHETGYSYFTYEYVNVYTNANANEEEQVKVRYLSNKWLKFTGSALVLTSNVNEASVFSWSYPKQEYYIHQKHTYPERSSATFGYNTNMSVYIRTRYKAYKEYSMLVNNKQVDLCKEDEEDIADLIDLSQEWKTGYTITRIPDARTFDAGSTPYPAVSGLSNTLNTTDLRTTVSTSSATTSPTNVKFKGKYVNIVDTLHVVISLDKDAPKYKFAQDWSSFKSIKDAELKIPLIRTTYHIEEYDSIVCTVEGDEYNYTFPNDITDPVSHTFTFGTERHTGKNVLDVNNTQVAVQDADVEDLKSSMHLNNKSLAQVRLIDAYGDEPDWCRISGKTDRTVTVQCTQDGIRAPRSAYIYIAYIVTVDEKIRFVNFRVTVSQPSLYAYANNQHLVHSTGASGDALDAQGMQRVHQNKRILYYYPEQNVELPVRESHFFGWWRWFREGGVGIGDTDIPEANWRTKPLNMGVNSSNNNVKYNYPFRIIGNEVPVDPEDPEGEKKLVTNGRYTVFHYKSSAYKDIRLDPPCKTALVAPPTATEENGMRDKPTLTYAVDISNYYDRLPMSVSQKNQVDTARLDTMRAIPEPTLSLREVFELRPWTEMAATMESYKSAIQEDDYGAYTLASERYMEDHVVMAPIGYQLLLSTEQRYNYANLVKGKHSESLLCYYMRDDNWSSMSSEKDKDGWSRQDSMIWCGGWDADCLWYTYDTTTQKYTRCTHKITDENDFLIVPKKENITAGQEFDTVYYCLRSRSRKSPILGGNDPETPPDGDYMFNICRYKVIYHNPTKYGPKLETSTSGVKKAIITNDEIEQNYEVLERLNFDYNKPGSNYKVYPHPLPWADASYGYTYPETADLPHNRLHEQSDFPNMGEYGLINKIPYSKYWYTMEQHGGAENGYMIYCDGMSSAGQVAALSLTTQLCEGQKMFFSCYVGNCSNQKSKSEDAVNGKSEPNFTFSVQGSTNGSTWEDITTYMTGDLPTSSQWYQIYFPVNLQDRSDFSHFRVRIYNMSSSWDGNDFVIDDMCLFATKPPLIAYQANTECVENATNDSITQVVLRIDYQGFTNDAYNGKNVYYTIQQAKDGDTTYVELIDHYLNETDAGGTPKMIYGYIPMPARDFVPTASELIFDNLHDLVARVEASEREKESPLFRQGYIFEEDVEGVIRPVMYVIHKAKMASDINYKVRMSLHPGQLTNSICAMTSELKVTSHIVLELNGKEQPGKQVAGQCANTTYDIAMRVKGSLYPDNAAPIDLNGSCQNDWLLFGDTAKESSKARYGYYYSDIVKVIKDILRCEPTSGTNANQFAPNFSSVSRNEMIRIQNYQKTQGIELSDNTLDAYTILSHLVNNGFLIMYKPKLTATLMTGEELRYVVFPIVGTGSDAMHNANVDVCPNPVLINIAPTAGGIIPMSLGGIYRDATQKSQPMGILANELAANQQVAVRIDSLAQPQITGDIETSAGVAIHSIELRETDDPEYLEALHTLRLLPDREWVMGGSNTGYYVSGDTLYMRPAEDNNYTMRAGYSYTFNINLMNRSNGSLTVDPADASSCRIGVIPFTLSVVPDYVRWEPKSEKSSAWNNPDNWIGINARNEKIHDEAHFVPLASSNVIIPAMSDGLPYPVLPDLEDKASYDSIKQIGFEYNKCNVIRFMPGAAMGQQQRMNYNKAVIDLSTPQEKWALRSTPVKGMLSGDIFRANADISNQTSPWEVGSFDDNGRNKNTGNASFWISLYSRESIHLADGNNSESDTVAADTEWAKITNVMSLPLPSASGWAVFTRTASGREPNAVIRLPKNDDIYYYYDQNGQIWYDFYEQNLQTKREAQAVLEGGHAGELAFDPDGASQSYTLTNGAESSKFVFGNPTMGYIDIWGFISDNTGLSNEFDYIDASGAYVTRNKATADATKDTITEPLRYLPPMHAIVLKAASAATSKEVTLNASRVVTVSARDRGASAPSRMSATGRRQGIMKVTAINPLTEESRSTLLVGQGYHNALRDGEDAMLTTININEYNSSAPTTLFNIYASEGAYGLCIDLLDEVVNVPVSFYMMKDVPFEPVTELWFSGVNNIDGELVFYDALTGSERTIADGICIKIPTPEQSHETRYYIRRRGFDPNDPGTAIATDIDGTSHFEMDGATAVKVIHNGHVLILRDGHVYTMFGQKLR